MRWQIFLIAFLLLLLISGCDELKPLDQESERSIQGNLSCPYECCPAGMAWNEKTCFYENQVCKQHECRWTSPVDMLNDGLIITLEAFCESLDKGHIADCVLEWQEKNMISCIKNPEATKKEDLFLEGYSDCNEPLQLNEMAPGAFPASKILERKRAGKAYGTGFEFAVTHCALARYYGLKCRVMASETRFSDEEYSGDYGAGYCGIIRKSLLLQLDESCEEWKELGWKRGPKHYWAEIFLDNKWIVREAKQVQYYGRIEDTFKKTQDYYDTGW